MIGIEAAVNNWVVADASPGRGKGARVSACVVSPRTDELHVAAGRVMGREEVEVAEEVAGLKKYDNARAPAVRHATHGACRAASVRGEGRTRRQIVEEGEGRGVGRAQ